MKTINFILKHTTMALLMGGALLSATAQPVLVSSINSAASPATGGGDSSAPIISRDGRYVAFSSAANNLATNTNGAAFQPVYPSKLNVFLRDRTNGTTKLISVNASGTGGGIGDSYATGISTNGQYVLFESTASNLVANASNSINEIFVRDVINGTTTLVSVSTNGGPANGNSRSSVMTPDGRYVAFVSAASNLVSGDLNGIADVFVRDLQGGTIVLASVNAMSGAGSLYNYSSEAPDISSDGRYLAFYSTATNLISGITNSGEIYVRDLTGGATLLGSTNAHSIGLAQLGTSNIICSSHVMSDDGQFIVYHVGSTVLTAAYRIGLIIRYNILTGTTDIVNTNAVGARTASEADGRSIDITPDGRYIAFITNNYRATSSLTPNSVCVWDAQFNTTTLVSGDLTNGVPASADCYWPQISADARYITFFASIPNLTADPTIGGYHLYARDTQGGTTTLVDPRADGSATVYAPVNPPSLSSDGSIIAFDSFDSGLVTNDNNRGCDVFVRNLATNVVEVISGAQPALPSLSPNGASLISSTSVSTNARYVAFTSEAENLVTNDTNFFRDVFVHDVLTGSNTLVSVATNGYSGSSYSTEPAISGDGSYVAFTSFATNLVTGDTNASRDVFLRDLQAQTTTLVSLNSSGSGPGNSDSFSPLISSNGRFILFHSKATNLIAGFPINATESLFYRDMLLNVTYSILTNTGSIAPFASMTSDGRYVTCVTNGQTMYVWDMQTMKRIYTNTSAGTISAVSLDGKHAAFTNSTQVVFVNITSNTSVAIGVPAANHQSLQFSADGRFLVFGSGSSGKPNQITLYDSQTGVTNLISKSYNSALGASNSSDSATISADGRFVAYRSLATNIVPSDFNGVPDVFLYDRNSGETTLMSASAFGNFSANNRSFIPVFSGDSQTLLITSWASDLGPNDFNQGGDLFAFSLNTSQPSFGITIIPPATIAWPVVAGRTYQVLFKNNLTDANWQIVNGNVTLVGNQGYITDLAPSPTQRFYQVVAF